MAKNRWPQVEQHVKLEHRCPPKRIPDLVDGWNVEHLMTPMPLIAIACTHLFQESKE